MYNVPMNEDEILTPPVEVSLEPQPNGGSLKRSKKIEQLPVKYEPSLESKRLTKQMEEELTVEDAETVNTICMLIGEDGLKLDEACRVGNVELSMLKLKIQQFPIIAKLLTVKESEYKHMLIRQMSIRARSGDDKAAQWLLAARYPDEFGDKKARGGGEEGMDLMAQAISFIQESGDSEPVVRKSASLIHIRRVNQPESKEVKTLKQFLS